MNRIKIEKLSAGFDDRPVVRELSCSLGKGGIHLMLGRAGSGKTTLLKTIAGFQLPIGGRIMRLASDGDQAEPWIAAGKVCLAFQNPETLFFCPTVAEEVCFALTSRDVDRVEAEQRGRIWLEKWGLSPEIFWKRNPLHLSGGEKRRVALAACTIFLPDLILLDEPLAGMDTYGQKQLSLILSELCREHVLVVVTHDPAVLLPFAQSVLVLSSNSDHWNWFSHPADFLQAALDDRNLYPLPNYYREAIEGLDSAQKPDRQLPWLSAESVFKYLTEVQS